MAIEQITSADTPNEGATKFNSLIVLMVETGMILSGAGAPAGATGTDGQYYFDTTGGDLYFKLAGAWGAAVVSLATAAEFAAHLADQANPHAVSAGQVGIADAGANFAATEVEAALAEEADARQAHAARTDNPHVVTRVQLGAAAQADLDAHTGNTANPHAVSAGQVPISDAGANFVATEVEAALAEEADARQAHEARVDNPHSVVASQVGITDAGANFAATEVEAALAEEADARQAHEALTNNPHAVTAAQAGAPTTTDFNNHTGNTSNPHAVTAAQAGAVADGGSTPGILYGTATTLDASGNPTPDTTSYPPANYSAGTLLFTTTAPTAADNGTGVVTTYAGVDMWFRRTGGVGSEAWTWVNGSFRASNSNGDYVRYADGRQVCEFKDSIARTTINTNGSVFQSPFATFTFPAAFIAEPTVSPSGVWDGASTAPPWANCRINTATQTEILLTSPKVDGGGYAAYVASGHWR